MASRRQKRTLTALRLAVFAFCLASSAGFGAVCDTNADGKVNFKDIFDIQILSTGRSASGVGDPRDADGNGVINGADVRICRSRCTLASCGAPANRKPRAVNDSATTPLNQAVTINLIANDRSFGGKLLGKTIRIKAKPKNGSVKNNRDGSVTYFPRAGYLGEDSFRYFVKDNKDNASNVARVRVTIVDNKPTPLIPPTPPADNQPPVANAGADKNVPTGQAVILDGSQSSDPEKAVLSFAWRFQTVPPGSGLSDAAIANSQSPSPNFTPDVDGAYELVLTVSDGAKSSQDTVVVTASTANVPPNVNAGTDQNTVIVTPPRPPVVVNLNGTATDPDNGPNPLALRWFIKAVPAGSALATNTDISNTAAASFTPDIAGIYTLTFEANDGLATVSDDVTINAANNSAPNADAGANPLLDPDIVVPLGDVVNLNGSASNDRDNSPSPLTYQWGFVSVAPGSTLINGNITGSNTVSPSFTPDILGPYTLRLDVSDGEFTDFDQVLVKANARPMAGADSYTATRDIPLNQAAPGVLANDSDGNSDPLTAVKDSDPANGSVLLNADGSFTYTPNAGFVGADSFTYHANDGSLTGNPPTPVANADSIPPATVTITVSPPNTAPTFTKGADQSVLEDAGAQTVVGWATNIDDGDAGVNQVLNFIVNVTSGSSLFSVQPSVNVNTGNLTYTPAANANGVANVTVTLQDDGGGVNTFTQAFTITVTSVNDSPVFILPSTSHTVLEDAPAVSVAGFATGIDDGDPELSQTLTFVLTGNTNPGLFSAGPALAPDGTLTFTPAANASGSANVSLQLSDGGGTSNGGVEITFPARTITINVTAVDDPPVAVADSAIVTEDSGANTINVLTNDTDIDAGPKTVNSVTQPTNGTVIITGGGTGLTYQPNLNFCGLNTFNYTLNGGSSAQVSVSVTCVNDPPAVTAPGPFTVTGNVAISVPAPGLLTTVSDPADGAGAAPFTVSSAAITSTQGGNVTVNTSTGAFTYNPPAGYEGADSFTYQVCDSGVPGSACTAATVNLTVSGMIWFINNSAAAGDGRLGSPFNSLATFQAINNGTGNNPAAGDSIFLFESASDYVGPLTLLNNQKLIGQDATVSLAAAAGITLAPNTAALPVTNSANGVIVNVTNTTANGTAIGLSNGANATIRGLTVGNVLASGNAIGNAGASFGTLTVSETTINTNGRALNLTNGTLNATLGSITSSGGANNVLLTTIAGTMNLGTGTLSGSTGTAFDVSGGTGTISYGGTITKTNVAQRPVSVASKTGGSVTFTGAVTANTGPTLPLGISLTNNTGSTINFQGGLALSTGSNAAFTATGGGTVNVTGATNTLATTTGTALNVANTTIGASGLTFQSIAANGAANGIVLNNTGTSGGLTVTGDGGSTNNGSGGTIQNTTANGIRLINTQNIALDQMNINNTIGSGIKGTNNVVNFSFTNGSISISDDAASDGTNTTDESNIAFNDNQGGTQQNLTGTVTITGNTLTNARFHGVDIFNYNGTISNATISNNTITSSNQGGVIACGTTAVTCSQGSGIRLIAFGSATTVANVTRATIANNIISNFPSGAGIMAQGGNADSAGPVGVFGTAGSATDVITITDNRVAGFSNTNRIGTQAIVTAVNNRGQGNFNVSNNGTVANPLTNTIGTTIAGSSFGFASVTATVNNNVIVSNHPTIGSQGIGVGTGRTLNVATETPTLAIATTNNAISQTDGNGILAVARDSTGQLNIGIRNNTVAAPLGGNRPGIRIDAGNAQSSTSTGAGDDVCLDTSGNTSAGSGLAPQGLGLRKQGTDTTINAFGVEGMVATATPGIETFINSTNPAGNGTLLISATSGFSNCSTAP